MQNESDPNGTDQHVPGAKFDSGKLRPWLVLSGFASALEAVVKVGTDGVAKYSDNGWKSVPNAENRYLDALERHLLALRKGEEVDGMSGSPHLAHVAWNVLAVLELKLTKTAIVANCTEADVKKFEAEWNAAKLPPIPEGWVLWDRKIPWESLPKERMQFFSGDRWRYGVAKEDTPHPLFSYSIPGEDAGGALVGIECYVFGDDNIHKRAVVSKCDPSSPFPYWCNPGWWSHARPTYIGKPEIQP